MIEKARQLLNATNSTLVVISSDGTPRFFTQRGVADLYALLINVPSTLRGAAIADKVIGKAAAALMIEGKVAQAYGRVITPQAITLLQNAGIAVTYSQTAPYIANRTNTGRCPLDTLAAPLNSAAEIVEAIRTFLSPTINK